MLVCDKMLTVSHLSFERYFQPVFMPLDFQLNAAELLLISGANGCGKTTLIRLLAGILTASEGIIQSKAKNLAYVGHMLAIKDDLTVRENIRFMRKFMGTEARSIEQVVHRMGLQRVAGQMARTLSAGQKKRCALARLLLSPAELWLLDEPYSNLDDEGVALVDGFLEQHCRDGGSSVVATHGSHRPEMKTITEIELISGSVDT
jgi:heme exporter protein A